MNAHDKIEVHTYVSVPQDLLAEVSGVFQRCFPTSFDNASDEHRDKFCSEGDVIRTIVSQHDGAVTGVAKILKRQIMLQNHEVFLGGIGGLGTHPEYRREGIAGCVMKQALEELRNVSCDIAYLCADFDRQWLTTFYESCGFVALNKQHTFLGKSGKRYTEWDGMIAPVRSPQTIQEILTDPEPFDIGVGNW